MKPLTLSPGPRAAAFLLSFALGCASGGSDAGAGGSGGSGTPGPS